jgi:hypothetical protein
MRIFLSGKKNTEKRRAITESPAKDGGIVGARNG